MILTKTGSPANHKLYLYVNGHLEATQEHAVILNPGGPSLNLMIGADGSGQHDSYHYFGGVIDEPMVWKQALTAAQVAAVAAGTYTY